MDKGGRGVKNFNILPDVLCEWPLMFLACYHQRSSNLVPHMPVNFMVYSNSGCQKCLALHNGLVL